MEYRDYYATLGVPRTATKTEIKKAFRALAREHHPDVNASDAVAAERRFKEVNEAYDVLGDPEKRKLYDQLGADWEAYQRAGATPGSPGSGGPGGPRGQSGGFSGFPGGVRFEYHGDPEDLAGFSDFFRTFFAGDMTGAPHPSGRSAHPGRRRSAGGGAGGLRIEDLFGGMAGPPDAGAGAPAGADRGQRAGHGTSAGHGGGDTHRGRATRVDAEAELEISLEDAAAGATARVQVGDRRLEVKVPAGIDTGGRIRLSGKAPDGGNLTLVTKVRPHPVFSRMGADVTRELPITLAEALLGAEVPVGTPAGRTLLLTIPAGTQNGRQFRLRGQGLPRFKGEGSGDLLVRTRVVLPGALDEEGRRLARQLVDHVQQASPRDAARTSPRDPARTPPTDHTPPLDPQPEGRTP